MAMLFAEVFLSWIHFLRFLTEGEKMDAVFFAEFPSYSPWIVIQWLNYYEI